MIDELSGEISHLSREVIPYVPVFTRTELMTGVVRADELSLLILGADSTQAEKINNAAIRFRIPLNY